MKFRELFKIISEGEQLELPFTDLKTNEKEPEIWKRPKKKERYTKNILPDILKVKKKSEVKKIDYFDFCRQIYNIEPISVTIKIRVFRSNNPNIDTVLTISGRKYEHRHVFGSIFNYLTRERGFSESHSRILTRQLLNSVDILSIDALFES